MQANATNSTTSDGSSTTSAGSFVLGVLIALLGSTGEQLGLTLWKLAENRIAASEERRRAARRAAAASPPRRITSSQQRP